MKEWSFRYERPLPLVSDPDFPQFPPEPVGYFYGSQDEQEAFLRTVGCFPNFHVGPASFCGTFMGFTDQGARFVLARRQERGEHSHDLEALTDQIAIEDTPA